MESFKLQDESVSFLCENCEKMINNLSNACRFCGFIISDNELKTKSETQTKINQAFNDANNLKFIGIACLTLSFPHTIDDILFGYFTNSYVNYFPHGLILIFLLSWIRWQFSFGQLQASDTAFEQAKTNRNLALCLWLTSIFLVFILVPIIEKFIFSLFK